MGAAPKWTTACPDWADRIKKGRSIIPPPIFPEEAESALEVLRALKIVDAPGGPTFGEACAPWVFDLAAAIFGAYDAENGRRLIREVFVCLPKKNMKSTLAAGIMVTALIRNWRDSGQHIILAPTVEIAKNSFDPSRDMVKHEEELDDLLHVQEHIKTITHRGNGGELKVVAADSNTVGGKKAGWVLVDELWLMGLMPDAENMLREATGGLMSRPEGVVIYLTTQSDDPPAGVFKQKLDYARGVRDGLIDDPQFLPIIYEFPPDMIERGEHKDPANFALVNPNMGYSVDVETINREHRKAENDGEASLKGFLAKHLNVEIGLNLRSDRWAGADYWLACGDKKLTLDALLERSEVVVAGGDGGGLDDLLGLAVMGRDEKTKEWLHWAHAWAHPSVLKRRKDIAARLMDFSKQGDLTLVEEIGQDVEQVADIVMKVEASGLLDQFGVDAVGISDILDALIARKFDEKRIVAVPQGWRLVGAIKTAERQLAAGTWKHGATELMAWCVGNAKVEARGNAVLITKQAAGSAKIDPLIATLNCVALLGMNPKPRTKKFQLFFAG